VFVKGTENVEDCRLSDEDCKCPKTPSELFMIDCHSISANESLFTDLSKEFVNQINRIYSISIQNKNYKSYKMTEHPFDEKMFKKMIKIVPVKDKRTL
jgi:hypothetical protein